MRKERFVISDRSWDAIEPLVPGTARDRGVTAKNTRLFLEAVLWRVRVGSPWRDLPPGFGELDYRSRLGARKISRRGRYYLRKRGEARRRPIVAAMVDVVAWDDPLRMWGVCRGH